MSDTHADAAVSFRRGDTGDAETVTGRVEEATVQAGSKSEHVAPVVFESPDAAVRVYVIGDNPFDDESLRELLGVRVRLTGTWRNGVVRVKPQDLEPLPEPEPEQEPAEPAAEPAGGDDA